MLIFKWLPPPRYSHPFLPFITYEVSHVKLRTRHKCWVWAFMISGKSMNMIKGCGKMPSKVRLEKNGVHQSMNGQFTIKYLIFREIWKIPCVGQIFPMLYLNSLCFPCLEKLITKFPVFPVLWPPCYQTIFLHIVAKTFT